MLPLLRSASRGGGVVHKMGEITVEHIKLDRVWLFEDMEAQDIFKVARKPFYSDPVFRVGFCVWVFLCT